MNVRENRTERQRECFEYVAATIADRGTSPTMKKIADHFGVARSAAFYLVNQLVRKGWLTKESRRHHSLRLVEFAEIKQHIDHLPLYELKSIEDPIDFAGGIQVAFDREFFPFEWKRKYFFVRLRYYEATALNLRGGSTILVRALGERSRSLDSVWCLVRLGGRTVVRRTTIVPAGFGSDAIMTTSKNRARDKAPVTTRLSSGDSVLGVIVSIVASIGVELGDFKRLPISRPRA